MELKVPANFIPRPYQLELFQAMEGIGRPAVKRAMLRWHRRAGKDKACLAYMFYSMIKRKGIYYYFMPNYAQGRKIIWEGIDKDGFKFLDHMPRELISGISNQEMKLELKNGSVFRVVGTDNIDSIVGTNPVGCVFSEYSLQDPAAWQLIRPILAENEGWAIFNGTPRGRNHMYDLDVKIRNRNDWFYSKLQTLWPGRDDYSGIVKESVIIAERESGMDEETIEQEFGVSYAAGVKGSFYMDLVDKARESNRIDIFPPDPHAQTLTYWDLGIDDSTSCWIAQRSGNAVVFIDYIEDSGKDIGHYIKILADRGYNYRTHYLPWDGGNRTIQTQFRTDDIFRLLCKEHGISDDVVVAPRTKVQDGINAVRSRFHLYHFNEGLCGDAIRKIELYHRRWDSKRNVFMKDPVHDWTSHCADALRVEATIELLEYGPGTVSQQDKLTQVIYDYDVFGRDDS